MTESSDPAPSSPDSLGPVELRHKRPPRWAPWLSALVALVALYLFIAAINLMGHGLKTIAKLPAGEQFVNDLFGYATHPLAGLCVGILLTSLVQSSSFTTTFTVGLVAAGQIELHSAVFIIMGANVGTSVTNLLVSLGHLRRRREFRRSLAGAIVHDFFNVLNVLLLLPLEMAFHIVSGPASAFANWLEHAAFMTTDVKKFNIVKAAVRPFADAADLVFIDLFEMAPTWAGGLTALFGVVLLFIALFLLVRMLQGLLKDRLSGLFSRTLFRNHWIAFVVGIFITAAVQSSSVTTSLVVPLVGAGVLKLRQIYPYTLGANIGTTITAILGALAAAAMASTEVEHMHAASGIGLALAHLLFNIYGTCIFWPLGWIPISLAKGFAKMAMRRRILAAAYIIVVFFVLPIVVIVVVNTW